MPNFETFKKRMVPMVSTPYVTIQKRGTMSFNKAAHKALGGPTAIELLYDPDEKIMGVRAVPPETEHAYPIRDTSAKRERTFTVSGRAFTKFYDIDTTVSRRRPAYMDEDVLCIDLKEEGTVVTGNRGPNKQKPAIDQTSSEEVASED